ncbi:hypothetical protein HYT33_00040 [Candidatus Roizmanbacteria bacterium]|nr:hypothetical protein [Candidatus Roizmanbacteria bacterium]
MDITQVVLTITLTVTTIFLVIVGVQVVLVLRELRAMLKRVNSIVEGFEKVGLGIESGYNELIGFFTGFKGVLKVLRALLRKKDEDP